MTRNSKILIFIILLTIVSLYIAIPREIPLKFKILNYQLDHTFYIPDIDFYFWGKRIQKKFPLKQGLDIQGGMQIRLKADMTAIDTDARVDAIESARSIILRRVDMFGISEPVVQIANFHGSSTASQDEYRLIVELPGVDDPNQALQLVGQTAQLDFRLEKSTSADQNLQQNIEKIINSEAEQSSANNNQIVEPTPTGSSTQTTIDGGVERLSFPAELQNIDENLAADSSRATSSALLDYQQAQLAFFENYEKTALTGKQLKRAAVQFDPQTSEPVISLEFNDEGRELFANITKNHVGEVLAIFIDDFPVAMPRINSPILDGRAIMSGNFTIESAKQLAIQLNAGALPVPIEIIEQKVIGASLGEESVNKSVKAGLIGLSLVMLFMMLYYGLKGVIATIALLIYSAITIAIYKLFAVTLTLPGIAGLILSIGMAVDANILIFERMKEELRSGQTLERAMELGFGRAWDSIKDANLATIMTALILVNPFDFSFLNNSGLVRGFGITLLIGVLISLFTGVVVTRTLMRIFLPLLVKQKNN